MLHGILHEIDTLITLEWLQQMARPVMKLIRKEPMSCNRVMAVIKELRTIDVTSSGSETLESIKIKVAIIYTKFGALLASCLLQIWVVP